MIKEMIGIRASTMDGGVISLLFSSSSFIGHLESFEDKRIIN
jgi:hypothetical protein